MRRCVLVVEDEPIVRLQTVAMLEAAGLTVVGFENAGTALDYTRANADSVAAIFTDIHVVGSLDGVELAARVAEAHPGVALLVTSGLCDGTPSGLPPNATFLRKPWLPLQVIQVMQDAALA